MPEMTVHICDENGDPITSEVVVLAPSDPDPTEARIAELEATVAAHAATVAALLALLAGE